MEQLTDSVARVSDPTSTTARVYRPSRLTAAGLILILAAAGLAGIIFAPVLEALIVYVFYQHWGTALAEHANLQPGVVAVVVPAAVTAALLLRKRRSIVRPWSWLRPYVLLFFLSLTVVESAKLVTGTEATFGPKGEIRDGFVIRTDGTVVVKHDFRQGDVDSVSSGRPFKAITVENRDWVEGMRRGGTRVPQQVDPAKTPWFLPGGQAIVFYAERNGRLEFFDRPGRHPEINAELKEVDSAIRDRWEQDQQRQHQADLQRQVRGIVDRVSRLEQATPAPTVHPQASATPSTNASSVGSSELLNSNLLNAPPRRQFSLSLMQSQTRREQPAAQPPLTSEDAEGNNGDTSLRSQPQPMPIQPNFRSIPRQFPPLHYNCGTRHWRWARCPRYGLPRPRYGAPRHSLCGYFHWPSEGCPRRDYSPTCRYF